MFNHCTTRQKNLSGDNLIPYIGKFGKESLKNWSINGLDVGKIITYKYTVALCIYLIRGPDDGGCGYI